MAGILNLKKYFQNQRQKDLSYKHAHYLNTRTEAELEEILLFSEADQILSILPMVTNKKTVFFNDQKHKFLYKKIFSHEPQYFLNYIYKAKSVAESDPKCCSIYGNLNQMALKQNFFDVAICPFVLTPLEIDDKSMARTAAVLKNGGRLILSVKHMQLEHMLYNQNPAKTATLDHTLSQYFKVLKNNNLYVEELEEGLVDKGLKPFFNQEPGVDHYHEYKNTPVTLAIKAVKFVKNQKG